MATNAEEDLGKELMVTFFPNLFLQRRIWILNVLRNENIDDLLDVGCGSGQLISVLTSPSPWLAAPPASVLYPDTDPPVSALPSPVNLFNISSDPIPNLHIRRLSGLDISALDLKFAVQAVTPSSTNPETLDPWKLSHSQEVIRWEDMTARIWQGGLEVINEEFVGTQAIVSSEVIEHLPPDVFPFFAPVLLGVYRPNFLLITTPSYTFNARFTSPDAHPSVRLRSGYLDPTGRTSRIFRHDDHKFEWTPQEFGEYCEKEAKEWGYHVQLEDIGRAQEVDEWDRDAELGGASLVAKFTRIDDDPSLDRDAIERRARDLVKTLTEQHSSSTSPSTPTAEHPSVIEPNSDTEQLPRTTEHQLLASHYHPAHPSSQNPLSLREIGDIVKGRMEELRESFMRIEELWYEPEVSKACGGWIEVLIRAVEEYDGYNPGSLTLTKDAESPLSSPNADTTSGSDVTEMNIQRQRDLWKVGLVGATSHPRPLWPTTEIIEDENDKSVEYMPSDWNPEREYISEYHPEGVIEEEEEEYDYGQMAPGNSVEWEEEISVSYSTGEEGDISWGEDEHEEADIPPSTSKSGEWGSETVFGGWGAGDPLSPGWGQTVNSGWAEELQKTELVLGKTRGGRGRSASMPLSSSSSMTGWDGDEDDTDTTS
ncbi:hypothetical protein GYMLUDRAFT_203822 [Collybiopsis luxurians FD-317 M1]|uniref:Small RNA 2'-O-methyltransferase n=1 Tax=Collybiopsis luxurians FD-317 M1 TaxID=944289 RepID=A0A0D0BQI6_9AGAR|nr:hypothetical protein GYMLUDRAFT_203822 [Collybiopsis luxurians FD-317 M1]